MWLSALETVSQSWLDDNVNDDHDNSQLVDVRQYWMHSHEKDNPLEPSYCRRMLIEKDGINHIVKHKIRPLVYWYIKWLQYAHI